MEESGEDLDHLAKLGRQILGVLDSDDIAVSLQNGKVVEGSATNFSVRKKTRKGETSWSGSFSVETDSGVLEMDCSTIVSVEAN
jgi:hypothetical protein